MQVVYPMANNMSIKGRSGGVSRLFPSKYLGMEPRTYCFIAVFVGSGAFAFLAVATPVTTDPEALTVEEQTVFLDCKNADYRTYIACLKRQKRHHSDHDHNGQTEKYDEHCLESCLPKCERDNTMHDCYKICGHCIRRTKHKHQIITEYETECEFGVCSNKTGSESAQPVKIDTTIHIDNHLSNKGKIVCSLAPLRTGDKLLATCRKCVTELRVTRACRIILLMSLFFLLDLNNSCPCPPMEECHCPPVPPAVPPSPVIIAPRLVIDFNSLQLGGCQWPCYPGFPGWNNIDCSPCVNPLTIHKCHVSCRRVNTTNPCVSPECVGGTVGINEH